MPTPPPCLTCGSLPIAWGGPGVLTEYPCGCVLCEVEPVDQECATPDVPCRIEAVVVEEKEGNHPFGSS